MGRLKSPRTLAFPIVQIRIGNVELTLRCANAPTSMIKNMTRRFLNRLFNFPSFGSTTTSTNAAVAMALAILVIFNERLMAT